MKFANIDEAILEAAKITGNPKTAPKNKGKKVPAKKLSKQAEAPKGKKAPIPAPKKKAPVAPTKKASAPTKPAASATPEPAKADAPKAEPAPAAKSEPAPSRERPQFAPRWLTANRGIGDRLKDAWKSFKASAGQNLGKAGASYKSVFHEAQQLMKEYQMIESMLQEQALYEGLTGNQGRLDVAPPFGDLTAADFEELRGRKSAIREALAAQMVREELYFHRTNLAELNTNQRVALAETVKSQCDEMFTRLMSEGMGEEDENSHTLEEWMGMMAEAGFNLNERNKENKAAKDMFVGQQGQQAIDAGRFIAHARDAGTAARERKLVGRAVTSRDPQASGAESLPIATNIRRLRHGQARAQAQMGGDTPMEEQFTLEEWMGALQEAGYDTTEIDESLRSKLATLGLAAGAALAAPQDAGAQSTNPAPVPNDSVSTTIAPSLDHIGPARSFNRMNLAGRKITPHPTAGHGAGVQTVTPRPDGTFLVTTDYREQKPEQKPKPKPNMEEHYTLEEWMGALQEAGYDTTEIDESLRSKLATLGLAAGAALAAPQVAKAQGIVTPQDSARMVNTARTQGGEEGAAIFAKRFGDLNAQNKASGGYTQSGNSLDMQTAVDRAEEYLKRSGHVNPDWGTVPAGTTRVIKYNPEDGTYTATATAPRPPQPQTRAPQIPEQFTLEEWMGMMNEAGYELEEVSQADIMGGWQGTAPNAPGANPHTEMGLAARDAQGNAEPTTGEKDEEDMEEQFTLEEWMGMLGESGYTLNELSPDEIEAQKNSPEARLKASWRSGRAEGPFGATGPYFRASDGSVHPVSRTVGAAVRKQPRGVTKIKKREAELRGADADRLTRASVHPADAKELARSSQAYLKSKLQATGVKGYNRPNIDAEDADKQAMDRQISKTLAQPRLKRPIAPQGFDDSGVPVVAESINENTVSRFQQLAGIKPAE